MRRLISTISILVTFNCCFGQGYFNQWYFGTDAGIDFNTNPPTPLLNNAAYNESEGCASISDNNGNLLFYASGYEIRNKNHLVMLNGNGLMGNY